MNLVVVLALVAEGGHVHAPSTDAAHPCAVCAVGSAPAVTAPEEPSLGAPEPTEPCAAERPVTAPAARAVAVPASRGPPALAL
jgi:hypothetical protein